MLGMRIPSELLPRCRECGRIMVPWVRDDTFLEGRDWKDGVIRYESFLKQCLTKEKAKRKRFAAGIRGRRNDARYY